MRCTKCGNHMFILKGIICDDCKEEMKRKYMAALEKENIRLKQELLKKKG